MGIFIGLSISKSVTRDEWQAVYSEALQMAKRFSLFDIEQRIFYGEKVICAVPVEEKEWTYWVGWGAMGDLESMKCAETFCMARDFDKWAGTEEIAESAIEDVDAILSRTGEHMAVEDHGDWNQKIKTIWYEKTQGEPYHMYLLAIACMITEKLGHKAYLFGDITRGQCKAAARLAGRCLKREVKLPDTCDADTLCERIQELPLSEKEKVKMFLKTYLGNASCPECGQTLTRHFPEGAESYWQEAFGGIKSITYQLEENVQLFLSMGFDLEKLCEYISWHEQANQDAAEQFIRFLMKTEIYKEEKNCEDCLVIDKEEEEPYSIYTQMAQIFFVGARNRRVDRYIPLKQMKQILQCYFGESCDVTGIIEGALKENEAGTPADTLNDSMDQAKQKLTETAKTYDIWREEQLPYYQSGDSISPGLQKGLFDYFLFYRNISQTEERYAELMKESAAEKCGYLAFQNRSLLLAEETWKKIFRRIEEDASTFSRYYPMVRVKIVSETVVYIVRSLVTNDDLWNYCEEHAEEYAEEHAEECAEEE